VTIATGSTGTSFTLNSINDLLLESNETIIVYITGAIINATEFGAQTQTVTILDDDVNTAPIAISQTFSVAEDTT